MIINFDRTAAYRCPACGEITFGNFSMFELSGTKGVSIQCTCGQSALLIVPENKNQFTVVADCMICDEPHRFSLPFHALAKKDCTEFTCPDVMITLACIGRNEAVHNAIIKSEHYISELLAACGLEHTGKNGVTMLKALDKIQELSDDENLYCQCGSKMIDVEIREDDLILECCLCGARLTLTTDMIRSKEFSQLKQLILKHR